MAAFAKTLVPMVRRSISDQTGLTGYFDADFDFIAELPLPPPPPGVPAPDRAPFPSVFTVLPEQLGLKLDSRRGPVDVLVIDRIEKPTDDQAEPTAPRPPSTSQTQSPAGAASRSALEVRLAENAPGPGLVRATVQNSDRQIYLHDTTVVTGNDVMQARVVTDGGQFNVAIGLSPRGAEKMSASTAAHSGRPLAIIVNGVVAAAPTARGRIGDQVLIYGDFTREQADRIAEALHAEALQR